MTFILAASSLEFKLIQVSACIVILVNFRSYLADVSNELPRPTNIFKGPFTLVGKGPYAERGFLKHFDFPKRAVGEK